MNNFYVFVLNGFPRVDSIHLFDKCALVSSASGLKFQLLYYIAVVRKEWKQKIKYLTIKQMWQWTYDRFNQNCTFALFTFIITQSMFYLRMDYFYRHFWLKYTEFDYVNYGKFNNQTLIATIHKFLVCTW